ncbi:MAG: tRNA dimethylallyltransferase [Candidatus Tokpelaia sp. JSC161]|nr:MAG: tRNA dimethylallyltransferase [Candidatus Tokpelaia sp. JSC161]
MKNDIVLITGPTASGKSKLAVDIARQCDGIIINADSMQVYDVLRLLTSRPSEKEKAGVAHYLYGFVNPRKAFSVGYWLSAVDDLFVSSRLIGKTCIFIGGSGLYFHALLGGLSSIPHIDAVVREKWRISLEKNGIRELYSILLKKDPFLAKRLSSNDSQRIIRALEVLESTGYSITYWQNKPKKPFLDAMSIRKLVLEPTKNEIEERIHTRFELMLANGVIEEVKQLRMMNLNSELPVMKAIGVRELNAYLDGFLGIEEAVEKVKIATRGYAKKQMTWFRHQLDTGWQRLTSADSACFHL